MTTCTAQTVRAIRDCVASREWRNAVSARDGYACRSCGIGPASRTPLHVHHLRPFAEILREHCVQTVEEAMLCHALWDSDNGVTLCRGCHDDTHRSGSALVLGKVVLSVAAVEYRRWWSEQRPDVPYGSCWCGCGAPTTLAKQTATKLRYVRGEPVRYVRGHGYARPAAIPEYVVKDRTQETLCWMWQRHVGPLGYGTFKERGSGKPLLAHRVYFERRYGPVPVGFRLTNLCGSRACVNPEHWRAGGAAEAVQHGATAKLEADDVLEIRILHNARTLTNNEIAGLFGVSAATVSLIGNRRTWQNV